MTVTWYLVGGPSANRRRLCPRCRVVLRIGDRDLRSCRPGEMPSGRGVAKAGDCGGDQLRIKGLGDCITDTGVGS